MNLGLDGRVVIITGSGRGIGAATAALFAREGARVVISDLDQAGVDAQVAALTSAGHVAVGWTCDIMSGTDTRALADRTIEAFGRIDVLVNNAAVARDKSILKMAEADFDLVVNTTLKGAFHCCRAVLPHMFARRWGRIVNLSSRSMFGNPGQTNHSAAKAGIIGFTRALALEQSKNGITVNAVAPGFVETEGMRALPTYPELRESALEKNPVGFLGQPDDIGNVIVFLASDQARYVSGTTVFATGGRYSS